MVVSFSSIKMKPETESHKIAIQSAIEIAGHEIKSALISYLHQELPELPFYEQSMIGFDSYGMVQVNFVFLKRGVPLVESDWSSTDPLIVLENGGIFKIPFQYNSLRTVLRPRVEKKEEIDTIGYIKYASKAIEQIDRWSERAKTIKLSAETPTNA